MSEFLNLMEGWEGYRSVRGYHPEPRKVDAAIALIENKPGWPSHVWEYKLREAVTTSDFPNLLGFVIDREVLARYGVCVADWKSYFRIARLANFNTRYIFRVVGNDDRLPMVPEKGEYLVGEVSDCYSYYRLYKYGRQFDISWESIVNDVLNAFADIPERMANAAIRTEAYNATDTYASATGPDAALFGAPIVDCGQNVTNLGVLPLTIANLETTLQLMSAQTDSNGEPICPRGVHLVVPPQLEYTARQILTSGLKQWTEGAVGVPVPYPTTNVVSQVGLQLHVDPYLPVVDTSATNDTTWYLFADPSQGVAMEFGYLRGHEAPEICMKASDKVTTGGAAISPMEGDFATDNIFYRVRLVKGSTPVDPRFAYAQQAP
jgi:hypothetical protein